MLYESTRGLKPLANSALAIKDGICEDGGLFVPDQIPKISEFFIEELIECSYQKRALKILELFLDDFSKEELDECIVNAYSLGKFSSNEITPLINLTQRISILELWHGPTIAFKDMALQILPHLLIKAIEKSNEKANISILVATSGDTGKAALEGFKNVEGINVIVFYPNKGISEIQKLQMVTSEGKNVHAIAINGDFDDAQNGIKEIFTDKEFIQEVSKKNIKFSSANSINWGRLVPQIVYYFSAYVEMIKQDKIELGEKVNFAVPTGNFGNILAGFYAKEMGLPINKLICASNENNVLTDFINRGFYDKNIGLKRTISPSMDILISSNLERLLYEINDRDSSLIRVWMDKLRENGEYKVDEETRKKLTQIFWADYSSEEETYDTIRDIFDKYRYVVDTHTAVAANVYEKYVISTGDDTKTTILSTASPFKFNKSVARGIFGEKSIASKNEFEILDYLSSQTGMSIPKSLIDIEKKNIIHKKLIEKNQIKDVLREILKV